MSALALLTDGLPPRLSPDGYHLLNAVIQQAHRRRCARDLANSLGYNESSLMSVLFRAKLPSPKALLDMAALVMIAEAFQQPGATLSSVAYDFGFASPQCMSRWLRRLTGDTPAMWRGTAPSHVAGLHWCQPLAALTGAWATFALPTVKGLVP